MNKTQKIMFGVVIALLVGVIIIQLVVKQKVVLNNGTTGTAGVFNSNAAAQTEITNPATTVSDLTTA